MLKKEQIVALIFVFILFTLSLIKLIDHENISTGIVLLMASISILVIVLIVEIYKLNTTIETQKKEIAETNSKLSKMKTKFLTPNP